MPPSGTDPTSGSLRPRYSLDAILEHVEIPIYTFETFSQSILTGRIKDGDARLQVLKRYKENGSSKHKFVTLQVVVGNQKYWLRIERAVQANTRLSTSDASSSVLDSYDTVSADGNTLYGNTETSAPGETSEK